MKMSNGDWGIDQWDVDSKAESLNKALFGKSKKTSFNHVKPDFSIGERNATENGQDSGDDDDEKLSKKAKKKLKERRRKENMKNKKMTASMEDGAVHDDMKNEVAVKENENKKLKSAKGNKKLKEFKSGPKTKVSEVVNGKRKAHDTDNGALKSKKKKDMVLKDKEEGTRSPKKRKIEEGKDNSNLKEGDEQEKKKRRKKKKKPSSKKNKYKHLGLKSDRPAVSDSDSEKESKDQEGKKILNKSKTDSVLVENKKVTPEKGRKRKRSLSPENAPVKKTKLEESKTASPVKAKKQKNTSGTPQAKTAEEKEDEISNRPEKTVKELKRKNKDKSATNAGKVVVNNRTGIETGSDPKEKSDSKKIKKEKNLKKSTETIDDFNKKEERKDVTKNTVSPFFSSQGMELQQKCKDKLISGRFRFINEQLYTIKGGDAFRMFQQDKTLMDAYNTGFQSQVKQWSVNPLDIIIKQLSSKPKHLKVADFGCGEARLSASVPQKVHSLDLYALNERVTVCNMAKTPLDGDSLDIVVFCLSLMGTNLNDYLLEANRVLKEGGILKIAEVVSRFTNFNLFVSAVTSMGFRSVNSRELSKMFYLMDFKKVKSVKKSSKQIKALSLNPCVYKKR